MTDTAALERQILSAVAEAADEAALEAARVAALGKKGSVSELLKTLGTMSPEQRKENGPLFNKLRDRVTDAIAARKAELESAGVERRLAESRVDIGLPAPEIPRGSVHPVSQVMSEVAVIFA